MKWAAVVLAWGLAVAAGVVGLARYAHTGGSRPQGPARYPLSAELPLEAGHFTLTMAVHPQCPCSRASLQELSHLLAAHPQLAAKLLFVGPGQAEESFYQGDLWRLSQDFPRTVRVKDPEGRLAKRLGAETSGHAFLFGPEGNLRFSGGITPSRGHQGPSVGASSVSAWLRGQSSAPAQSDVFGCALFSVSDEAPHS